MFFKFKIFFLALVFLLSLEIVLFFNSWSWVALSILTLISLFGGRQIGGRWSFSILPLVLALSSIALLFLITLAFERQIFILLSAGMYYLSLLGAFRMKSAPTDQTARGMLVAGSFTALFFSYSSFYGFYLNFLVPVSVLIVAYFLVTLLLGYGTLRFFEKDRQKIWFFSLVVAFSMAQIVWTLNFWPFGYLTTGVIALILYYVLWEIVRSHFSLILSKKRMIGHLATNFFLIVLVLLTSKWIPNF